MDAYVRPYSDEQRRTLINLEQHYQNWIEVERQLSNLPYGMKWASRSGRDYLYQVLDRAGNAKSLGPRSTETEAQMELYTSSKTTWDERRKASAEKLAETCGLYRSLRLPLIPSEAAKILREADRRHLLDGKLLVVGTNAMPAYHIEAGGKINDAPDETDDFDMTWAAPSKDTSAVGVMAMLKAVDSTFTVNTERTFQARNAKAYEFELLAAPSTLGNMVVNDKPVPIALEEQEWLLLGTNVSRVVVARDGSPARITAPDPRYFALQKLWMSAQEKRDPLKRPKDFKQGMAVLSAVRTAMPHLPLNDEFEQALPTELQAHFSDWRASFSEDHDPSLGW
jgi:hypothetical protein